MQGLALATALEVYLSLIQFFRLSILGSPHHLTSPSQPLPCSSLGMPANRSWRVAEQAAGGHAALLPVLACLGLARPPRAAHLHGLGMRGSAGVPPIRQGRPGWFILLVALYYMGFAAFAVAQPQTPMTFLVKPCIMSVLGWLPTSAVAAQLGVITLPACLALVSCLLPAQRGLGLRALKAGALLGVALLLSSLLAAPALSLVFALYGLRVAASAELVGSDVGKPDGVSAR